MSLSEPVNLSADATSGIQAKLVWEKPLDDGGTPVATYEIFRSLNGATSVTIGTTPTSIPEFTDSTLSPKDNAVYKVRAKTPTQGPFSDPASTTTASSEAQTIQELLFDNWSLTGELAKTTTNNMTEPVHFFERGQVPGNKFPKAITVQKINEFGNENVVEHPKFFEESETFEITCFLQVPDAADDVFAVWIDLMQQMTSEVTRILKTSFSPSASPPLGQFFRSTTGWTKDDTFFPDDPELTRTLRFDLTRLRSNTPEAFLGYGALLAFDTSASTGDDLPTSDYFYTQIERVQIVQGWRNLPYLTTDAISTTAPNILVGVPVYYRGAFSGRFSCLMQLKKSDIDSTTLNSLSKIFLPQTNGELGTATLLHSTENTESSTVTFTESVPVNITEIDKVAENEDLVKFTIRGNLTRPTEFSFLSTMLYENTGTMEYENVSEMLYE